jgi:hypothetical protein
MIWLENVVRRHPLRYRLHGSKVIAHPRKTGKLCGCGSELLLVFLYIPGSSLNSQQMPVIDAEVIEFWAVGKTALGCN